MKIRMHRLLILTCVLLPTLVGITPSQAKGPSFFDVVPEDAAVAIYAPNYAQFEAKADQFMQGLGLPVPAMADMRAMMGLGAGINMNGPMGIVATGTGWDTADGPPMLLLVPITDYGALLGSIGAEAGDGVTEVMLPMGEPGFVKKVNSDFALIASTADAAESFKVDHKAASARAAKLAKGVVRTAETSAISVLILDMAVVSEFMEEAMSQMPMAAMAGGADVEAQMEAMMQLMKQTNVVAMGLDASQLGLSLHAAAGFVEGTELYEAAKRVKRSGALFNALPDDAYIFSMAMDAKAADIFAPLQAMSGSTPNVGMNMWSEMQGKWSSMEFAMYIPPTGLMGGLLTRGVTITHTDDADALLKLSAETMTAMNGVEEGGIKFRTTFESGADEIAGTEVAKYSVNMIFPPEMMQQAQGLMMMFGGSGPRGFMLAGKGAVISTMGTDKKLVEKTLQNLAGDGGDRLGHNPLVTSIAKQLPKDRVAEGYIAVGDIMRMIVPMAAMFLGPNMQIEIPDDLPPVGFAMTMDKGEAGSTTFVPMQLIQSVHDIVQTLSAAAAPTMQESEEDEDFPF